MAGTLPWALMLAAAGGGTWWLLSRELAVGWWLLAALLIGHGLVHLLFAVPAPTESESGQTTRWPFEIGRSWVISRGYLDAGTVRAIMTILIAVAVGGFALAGLSTLGAVVPGTWWPVSVVVAAVASAVALVVCFDPQLVLGLGMDAVLVWVAAARVWAP